MKYYIYAFREGNSDSYPVEGIEGAKVSSITSGELSAVVSPVSIKKLRPQRKNLVAHQQVLRTVMAETTPLPVAFGMVADSEKEVRKVLDDNEELLANAAARVRGRMEMTLRVSLNVPDIFSFFVENYSVLRKARDRCYRKKYGPSHEDKIELGRLFDRLLSAAREKHTAFVREYLQPYSDEIRENACRDERLIMDLACLVDRAGEKPFEDAIFEAATHFDNNYSFDYNGPLVPHNFVELALTV